MRALLALFLVPLIPACAGDEPQCVATRECAMGSHCLGGRCGWECQNNFECEDPDRRCDERGRCVLIPGADADTDVDTDVDTDADTDTNTVGGVCPDFELGNEVPTSASGNTSYWENEALPSCRSTSSPDVSYRWTAPSSGTYQIDLLGSSYDTVLFVRSASCTGSELACDDDGGDGTTSLVTLTLSAGQTIVIFVDGYSNQSGNYVLNVTRTY